MQTLEDTRSQGLDKFYTIPSVVEECLIELGKRYNWDTWDHVLEPSAGNGSFYHRIPCTKKVGIDLSPEHPDIIQQDFFEYGAYENGNVLVVGNPPFGRVSSLAVRFFNHAATLGTTVIAFIIPRTFRRVSIQNKLNMNFHLVYDMELPTSPCCFEPAMMVKCCFQIWEYRDDKRNVVVLPTAPPDDEWEFLPMGPKDDNNQPTPPNGADFALRAYGGKCGDIVQENLHTLRPKSWHFIKAKKVTAGVLLDIFRSLDYSISTNTARQNSIGRAELVRLYSSYKSDS